TVAQNAANQLSATVQSLAKVNDPTGTTVGNSGASPNASATGGQNVTVNGVSQITQVAGNSNVGVNGATIDFGSAGSLL
ncbi:peptidase C39, partial [Paraburkholderia sp. SIMBA_030]